MGKITSSCRKTAIRIKRKRQGKIRKLLGKLTLAHTDAERKALANKAHRVNPHITIEDFLARGFGQVGAR